LSYFIHSFSLDTAVFAPLDNMKLATVLAALAVGVSAQFAAPDLDKGKTREEIGREFTKPLWLSRMS
jgi:hypothetical protein